VGTLTLFVFWPAPLPSEGFESGLLGSGALGLT
jgi:hypothetical protein